MAKQAKKKLKKSVLFRILSFVVFFVSFIALYLIHRLGVLPFKYFLLLILLVLILDVFNYRMILSKNWKKRMFGFVFSIFLLIMFGVGIFYESFTLDFFKNAFQSRERIENYQVLILKSSNYGSLQELKSGKIGVPFASFSEGARMMQNEIKKKTSLTLQECDNSTLVESLLQKNLRVIVMEEAQKNLFMEIDEDFANQVKVIDTISVSVKNQVTIKDAEITKKPFTIYISGSDDYGKINQVSRSDVNILVTVNPITHKVLLTSIPRDYYVTLSQMDGAMDKLTHASLYGIDTSMKTLENLLNTKISYYVKVNFSSLVTLVDAVDGIEVESDVAFQAHYYDEPVDKWVTVFFKQGTNFLNGKEALAFSRERKSFLSGDRERAYHQQLILTSLIHKISSPTILTNYTDILNALNGAFDTNLGYEDILSFLQKQLSSNASWEIFTNILEGSDGSEKVYSMPKFNTYVMKPDAESVANATLQIQEILKS